MKTKKSTFVFLLLIFSFSFLIDNTFAQKPELVVQMGHNGAVTSVAFSPDGKYALSGSWDCKMKLWEIETGKELASLISMDENDWVVVTPEGYFDGSPNGMKNIHWVSGLEIYPLDAFYNKFYVDGLLSKIMKGERY